MVASRAMFKKDIESIKSLKKLLFLISNPAFDVYQLHKEPKKSLVYKKRQRMLIGSSNGYKKITKNGTDEISKEITIKEKLIWPVEKREQLKAAIIRLDQKATEIEHNRSKYYQEETKDLMVWYDLEEEYDL